MATVAVEPRLADVIQRLKQRGHRVVDPGGHDLTGVQPVVLTGEDERMMGISDPETGAPVITARGRDAEEIVREVEARLRIH